MPNPIANITTSRLLAEAITPLHSPDLHRLYTDPLVVKTLASARKPLPDEKIVETIEQAVDHWRQHGFGYWVFHLKKDGQFIGRGGLTIHQFEGKEVVGLAYAVMPDYWNRGFATEIAAASLEVGFGHLGLAEIWSWALPDNLASQRVMEKLGFRYERDFEFTGWCIGSIGWRLRIGGGIMGRNRHPIQRNSHAHVQVLGIHFDRGPAPAEYCGKC